MGAQIVETPVGVNNIRHYVKCSLTGLVIGGSASLAYLLLSKIFDVGLVVIFFLGTSVILCLSVLIGHLYWWGA